MATAQYMSLLNGTCSLMDYNDPDDISMIPLQYESNILVKSTMCTSGFSFLVIYSKLFLEKKVSQQKSYVFYHKNKSPRKNVLIETKKLNLSCENFSFLSNSSNNDNKEKL